MATIFCNRRQKVSKVGKKSDFPYFTILCCVIFQSQCMAVQPNGVYNRVKGADGQPIPSWGFVSKTFQFQGKLFTAKFLHATVAGSFLGIDFLRKFRITVAPETSQLLYACTTVAPATAEPPLPSVLPIVELPVSIPWHRKSDSVHDDVKHLLQKFPSILRTGDVMPTPTHGVQHHIHTAGHAPVFTKYLRLDPEKLEIAQTEYIHL